MSPIRTYFIGSGSVGIPVLERLFQSAHVELTGVATQPDRAGGRKRHLIATPVAKYAEANGIALHKTASVNRPEFHELLWQQAVDIVVVMAFGQLLKEPLLSLPPFGCFNVHTSLLPRHRGAAPVQAAILAGDQRTGITFMQMDKGLDTGPLYEMHALSIGSRETAAELEERLGRLAAETIVDCLIGVCRGNRKPTAQPQCGVAYAPKIHKDDGMMDWRLPAVVLERRVRAYQPWPRAFFFVATVPGEIRLQIIEARVEFGVDLAYPGTVPGEILQADKNGLVIRCGQDALRLLKVVPEGKPEMSADAFLRGHTIAKGAMCRWKVVNELFEETATGK